MATSPIPFPEVPASGVTEQHVHLGGSVGIYRLWEMGQMRGIRGLGTYEDFISRAHLRKENIGSLDDYLRIFDLIESIQSGPESLRESIHVAVNGAFRTGGMRRLGPGGEGADLDQALAIRRLELRLSPIKRTGAPMLRGEHAGLYDLDRVIMAACEAAAETELVHRGQMQVGLIFCFGRDLTWEANRILAEKVRRWRDTYPNLIGVDLAGSERVLPLVTPEDRSRMGELFEEAAGTGADSLGRTIHCGETQYVTPDIFLETLRAVKPHRVSQPLVVAHSYWKNGDDRALRYLAEEGIVCELCPWSNHLTGAMPLARAGAFLSLLDEYGIGYTLNTDSPALQKTSLALEIDFLLREGGATPEQITRALHVADKSSFLPPRDHAQHRDIPLMDRPR